MDKRGKFIVIDGMDGSGKGTQIRLLQEQLSGEPVHFTREPGGHPFAEEIREILLRTDGHPSNPVADFFLFFAARGSHVEDMLTPKRQTGVHIISDRYDSSTYAFQIWGEERTELETLFDAVRNSLDSAKYHPTLYVFLDLPPEVAFERRKNDAIQAKSKFDIKPIEYHQRVRDGFKRFAKKYGHASFVDAERAPEQVHVALWDIVAGELHR